MSVYTAHGVIDDLNSNTTFTINVGFRPKAGVFWLVTVRPSDPYFSGVGPFSVGFWQDNNGTAVYVCHTMLRATGTSNSYSARFTDCLAATISISSRVQYVQVSSVFSTGLTLTRYGSTATNRYRLHWILFGGDITAKVGTVNIPGGNGFSPITVTGAGFEVLFATQMTNQGSAPYQAENHTHLIAHYDKDQNVYKYMSNFLATPSPIADHVVGSDTTSARLYIRNDDRHILVSNINAGNDMYLAASYTTSYPNMSFSYLSIREIPSWSTFFLTSAETTTEETEVYFLPRSAETILASSIGWRASAGYFYKTKETFSVHLFSPDGNRSAFSIAKTGSSGDVYNYSSSNQNHLPSASSTTTYNNSYWVNINLDGLVWTYKTLANSAPQYAPIFLLGLGQGENIFLFPTFSNSNTTLTRQASLFRTITQESTYNVVLLAINAARQILEVTSASLTSLTKRTAQLLFFSSNQVAKLLRRFFVRLLVNNSISVLLRKLPIKLLRVTSNVLASLRLPETSAQVLAVVSDSLAILTKRLFLFLDSLSDQVSSLEKTVLVILRAFTSWLAWIEFLILKVLEVITDTRNDLEREVTYLFRQWEQELVAVSSSLSEIFRTFLRTLTAESFQWARLDRIRGPVFALRSWLWRIGRRRHGCS